MYGDRQFHRRLDGLFSDGNCRREESSLLVRLASSSVSLYLGRKGWLSLSLAILKDFEASMSRSSGSLCKTSTRGSLFKDLEGRCSGLDDRWLNLRSMYALCKLDNPQTFLTGDKVFLKATGLDLQGRCRHSPCFDGDLGWSVLSFQPSDHVSSFRRSWPLARSVKPLTSAETQAARHLRGRQLGSEHQKLTTSLPNRQRSLDLSFI